MTDAVTLTRIIELLEQQQKQLQTLIELMRVLTKHEVGGL